MVNDWEFTLERECDKIEKWSLGPRSSRVIKTVKSLISELIILNDELKRGLSQVMSPGKA